MNYYSKLPAYKFWRTGVQEKGVFRYDNIWKCKWSLTTQTKFSTYGSCFAQHISRELSERKLKWVNAEPAPGRTPPDLARKFNYGVFSSRTGNIYTVKQLCDWLKLAEGHTDVEAIEVFEEKGRFIDSMRPAIEPDGFATKEELYISLASTARAFRASIVQADVFVFTLGLTEGWENKDTGQSYPMCPGTVAGQFDPEKHIFKNYTYPDIYEHMLEALQSLEKIKPGIKILLTVSPVPLTATASDEHVLSATTYSKSVLRAIAGDFAHMMPNIDYFPSYELISGFPTRGMFYEPNLRSVALEGVSVVMNYFFNGLKLRKQKATSEENDPEASIQKLEEELKKEELVCEEMILEQSNAS